MDLALTLWARHADFIPVNFLLPLAGAALDGAQTTAPWWCLRVLALLRLTNARGSVGLGRAGVAPAQPATAGAADRQLDLLGNYMTEEGQAAQADWAMLDDLGLRPATGAAAQAVPDRVGAPG